MANSHYLIADDESGLLISGANTVSNEVGICYFDPIEETLLEVSALNNHMVTVQPYKKIVRKYYLVINPANGNDIVYARLRIGFKDTHVLNVSPNNFYSVKTIISDVEPTLSNFDDLTSFNVFRVNYPPSGAVIPVWVYIESKAPLNAYVPIVFSLEYSDSVIDRPLSSLAFYQQYTIETVEAEEYVYNLPYSYALDDGNP